jgi:hypothetical protein
MSEEQLVHLLARWSWTEISGALAALDADGRIDSVERLGTRFWIASPSVFPQAGVKHER